MAQDAEKTIDQLNDEADIAADYLEGLLDIVDYEGDIEMGVRNNRPTVQIVADDFICTSAARIEAAVAAGACNTALIKPNQAGTLTEARRALEAARSANWASIVSARSGEGIDELGARINAALPVPDREVNVVVPYNRGDIVAELHERNRVIETEYVEHGTRVRAFVTAEMFAKLAPFA